MRRYAAAVIAGQPHLLDLLRTFSWPELRLHPWRHAVAVLAIMLGVGLALAEFSAAVRGVNGEPDARLRGPLDRLDARWLDRALAHPQVRAAMPVIEAQGVAVTPDGRRVPVRLLGVDALVWPVLQPDAGLRLREGGDRLDVLAPDAVFGNPAAQAVLGTATDTVELQVGLQGHRWRVAGQVALPGGPLLVADVAALQDRLGWGDQVSRLDIRLVPGVDAEAVWRDLQAAAPAAAVQGVVWERPGDDGARLSQVSRAYRVNLTVLALVALFTGAFLVFWVLSLSVTQRLPAFALLGVLGLDARQRQRLVWAESALLGTVGSALGLALGAALCLLPPVAGLPLGAHVGIAALLSGGILALPVAVARALSWLAPRAARQALALLALERARRYPGSAAVATSGVVAGLALSVALTVMVGSFRQSMMAWLDAVLPADLYVRALAGGREAADFARLTGDTAINDLAVFLAPGTAAEPLRRQIEALAAGQVQVSSAQAIRQVSLNIFDRSFAVTYWLQAVAIGMGLMGVSASFSAQVLVRRREFGLLRHLGLSRAQVLGLVAAEGALWTVLGAVAGLALGLAVSAVLVHVVNPQSFHWTMELAVPVGRLAALVLAVVAAGTLTAWASGRLAVRREAVLAVREEA